MDAEEVDEPLSRKTLSLMRLDQLRQHAKVAGLCNDEIQVLLGVGLQERTGYGGAADKRDALTLTK
eukprot:SAG11_NODE_4039_length_2093_cov_1.322969_2_plen_66_part_00